jgi:hypothetical protein
MSFSPKTNAFLATIEVMYSTGFSSGAWGGRHSVYKRPFWSRINCRVTRLRWAGSRSQLSTQERSASLPKRSARNSSAPAAPLIGITAVCQSITCRAWKFAQ